MGVTFHLLSYQVVNRVVVTFLCQFIDQRNPLTFRSIITLKLTGDYLQEIKICKKKGRKTSLSLWKRDLSSLKSFVYCKFIRLSSRRDLHVSTVSTQSLSSTYLNDFRRYTDLYVRILLHLSIRDCRTITLNCKRVPTTPISVNGSCSF